MALFQGTALTSLIFTGLLLILFRKPLLWLLKVLGRSALGLGFLSLWSQSGICAGMALGVNAFNALILGILGLPGLGFLLLCQWMRL